MSRKVEQCWDAWNGGGRLLWVWFFRSISSPSRHTSPCLRAMLTPQARVYADANEKLGRSWWDYGAFQLPYRYPNTQTTSWSLGVCRTTMRLFERWDVESTQR